MDRIVQILEYLPDAVFVLRRDSTIIGVNAGSAELYGYGREELPGLPFEVLLLARQLNGDFVICSTNHGTQAQLTLESSDDVLIP